MIKTNMTSAEKIRRYNYLSMQEFSKILKINLGTVWALEQDRSKYKKIPKIKTLKKYIDYVEKNNIKKNDGTLYTINDLINDY